MGAIRLAITNSTDEEYGGTTATQASSVTVTTSIVNEQLLASIIKVGKLVGGTLRFYNASYSANTWTTIGTINKKPTTQVSVPACYPTDGTYAGMVLIETNGDIKIYPVKALTGGGVSFTMNYETND